MRDQIGNETDPTGEQRRLETRERTEKLFAACRQGDVEMVGALVRRPPSMESTRGVWGPSLSTASVSVNVRDAARWTPLMVAASEGHASVVRFLLSLSVEGATSPNETDSPPPPWFKAMKAKGGKVQVSPQRAAPQAANQLGVSAGSGSILKDASGPFGWTALHLAASRNRTECVKILCENGCNVDAADMEGHTALHAAVSAGHEACVNALLKAGASPAAANKFGETPSDIARQFERPKMEALLLEWKEKAAKAQADADAEAAAEAGEDGTAREKKESKVDSREREKARRLLHSDYGEGTEACYLYVYLPLLRCWFYKKRRVRVGPPVALSSCAVASFEGEGQRENPVSVGMPGGYNETGGGRRQGEGVEREKSGSIRGRRGASGETEKDKERSSAVAATGSTTQDRGGSFLQSGASSRFPSEVAFEVDASADEAAWHPVTVDRHPSSPFSVLASFSSHLSTSIGTAGGPAVGGGPVQPQTKKEKGAASLGGKGKSWGAKLKEKEKEGGAQTRASPPQSPISGPLSRQSKFERESQKAKQIVTVPLYLLNPSNFGDRNGKARARRCIGRTCALWRLEDLMERVQTHCEVAACLEAWRHLQAQKAVRATRGPDGKMRTGAPAETEAARHLQFSLIAHPRAYLLLLVDRVPLPTVSGAVPGEPEGAAAPAVTPGGGIFPDGGAAHSTGASFEGPHWPSDPSTNVSRGASVPTGAGAGRHPGASPSLSALATGGGGPSASPPPVAGLHFHRWPHSQGPQLPSPGNSYAGASITPQRSQRLRAQLQARASLLGQRVGGGGLLEGGGGDEGDSAGASALRANAATITAASNLRTVLLERASSGGNARLLPGGSRQNRITEIGGMGGELESQRRELEEAEKGDTGGRRARANTGGSDEIGRTSRPRGSHLGGVGGGGLFGLSNRLPPSSQGAASFAFSASGIVSRAAETHDARVEELKKALTVARDPAFEASPTGSPLSLSDAAQGGAASTAAQAEASGDGGTERQQTAQGGSRTKARGRTWGEILGRSGEGRGIGRLPTASSGHAEREGKNSVGPEGAGGGGSGNKAESGGEKVESEKETGDRDLLPSPLLWLMVEDIDRQGTSLEEVLNLQPWGPHRSSPLARLELEPSRNAFERDDILQAGGILGGSGAVALPFETFCLPYVQHRQQQQQLRLTPWADGSLLSGPPQDPFNRLHSPSFMESIRMRDANVLSIAARAPGAPAASLALLRQQQQKQMLPDHLRANAVTLTPFLAPRAPAQARAFAEWPTAGMNSSDGQARGRTHGLTALQESGGANFAAAKSAQPGANGAGVADEFRQLNTQTFTYGESREAARSLAEALAARGQHQPPPGGHMMMSSSGGAPPPSPVESIPHHLSADSQLRLQQRRNFQDFIRRQWEGGGPLLSRQGTAGRGGSPVPISSALDTRAGLMLHRNRMEAVKLRTSGRDEPSGGQLAPPRRRFLSADASADSHLQMNAVTVDGTSRIGVGAAFAAQAGLDPRRSSAQTGEGEAAKKGLAVSDRQQGGEGPSKLPNDFLGRLPKPQPKPKPKAKTQTALSLLFSEDAQGAGEEGENATKQDPQVSPPPSASPSGSPSPPVPAAEAKTSPVPPVPPEGTPPEPPEPQRDKGAAGGAGTEKQVEKEKEKTAGGALPVPATLATRIAGFFSSSHSHTGVSVSAAANTHHAGHQRQGGKAPKAAESIPPSSAIASPAPSEAASGASKAPPPARASSAGQEKGAEKDEGGAQGTLSRSRSAASNAELSNADRREVRQKERERVRAEALAEDRKSERPPVGSSEWLSAAALFWLALLEIAAQSPCTPVWGIPFGGLPPPVASSAEESKRAEEGERRGSVRFARDEGGTSFGDAGGETDKERELLQRFANLIHVTSGGTLALEGPVSGRAFVRTPTQAQRQQRHFTAPSKGASGAAGAPAVSSPPVSIRRIPGSILLFTGLRELRQAALEYQNPLASPLLPQTHTHSDRHGTLLAAGASAWGGHPQQPPNFFPESATGEQSSPRRASVASDGSDLLHLLQRQRTESAAGQQQGSGAAAAPSPFLTASAPASAMSPAALILAAAPAAPGSPAPRRQTSHQSRPGAGPPAAGGDAGAHRRLRAPINSSHPHGLSPTPLSGAHEQPFGFVGADEGAEPAVEWLHWNTATLPARGQRRWGPHEACLRRSSLEERPSNGRAVASAHPRASLRDERDGPERLLHPPDPHSFGGDGMDGSRDRRHRTEVDPTATRWNLFGTDEQSRCEGGQVDSVHNSAHGENRGSVGSSGSPVVRASTSFPKVRGTQHGPKWGKGRKGRTSPSVGDQRLGGQAQGAGGWPQPGETPRGLPNSQSLSGKGHQKCEVM
uniref:Uncharacterized protein n=1 Tax=Chromera velia CCMP2878 TaxID=1169474 RepID=A0A0G4HM58_9ALVE|eukprot:Cvel_1147.t1-p1 / transcript=Cvel_1147.t1 / gene=Cvel_1147 / organism=Chromera_velia_CCMP2878 / gene_product=Protein phosphatase 1 regulatory subunit 12B, putative / transcript_product=Protein phosphatase 1 regulatory subunit 12B, putative / location=Cvel_scaffold38:11839-22438(+) / protein_length=2344 / sequence_SO=supercontig / SO=protein_coding / is_pseudo=false